MRTSANDQMLATVHASIPTVGRRGRYGDENVFISALWAAVRKRRPEVTLDAFMQWLVRANRDGRVILQRADMVDDMDPELVDASEVRHLGATFHFVIDHDGDRGKSMSKSPEQIDREVRALAGSMLASKRPTERLSELDAQIDRALSGIEDAIGIKRRGRRRTKSEIAKARADAAKIRKEAAEQKKRAAEIKKKAREDAARAKKIAAEEKKRAAKIKKQAAAEKKKATAAKRERKTAVRDAAAIRKRARVSAAKTTLAAKTAAPASRASDADQRATVVRSTIAKVGSAGRFGDKVFVHPIWKIAGDKLGMTLAEFKLLLLALNRAGKITLARLDLIGAIKDQDMVRLSEIEDRGATFHTVMA